MILLLTKPSRFALHTTSSSARSDQVVILHHMPSCMLPSPIAARVLFYQPRPFSLLPSDPPGETQAQLVHMQVERESQVYESTLQKMNQQLETSLATMAGEKAALQLSLTGLQHQFEGVAQAVYSADDSIVGPSQKPRNQFVGALNTVHALPSLTI